MQRPILEQIPEGASREEIYSVIKRNRERLKHADVGLTVDEIVELEAAAQEVERSLAEVIDFESRH